MDTSKATARLSARVGQIRYGRGANKGRTFADGYVTRDGIEVGAIGCVDVETTERIVRAVNSHDALVAALRGIPPSPVSRPVTSAEWEVADRFEGFFNAFEGTAVRSIRSAAYERGMADGKHARAALALAEQGGG